MREAWRELARMSLRQRAALFTVCALSLLAAAAGLAGKSGWALVPGAGLGLVIFVALLQVRRRAATADAARQRQLEAVEKKLIRLSRAEADRVAAGTERADAAHRRLLATVECERLAAADRHEELIERIERRFRGMALAQRNQTRDFEALLQLYQDFVPRAPMPPSGRWTLDAPGLLAIIHLATTEQPKLVLELGSGISTVWLGYFLERYGGRLVSVEHSPEALERTRSMLELHSLTKTVEVRLAPLRTYQLDGQDYRWYEDAVLTDLTEVGLLIVDGPPGGTCRAARYPALPVLAGALATGALIVLDDANRPEEREIVEQWLSSSPLSPVPSTNDRQAVLIYSPS